MSHDHPPLTTAPHFNLPTQKGDRALAVGFPGERNGAARLSPRHVVTELQSRFGELARHAKDYEEHGAQVVAVVAQKSESVRRYIEETGLPFNVLIDESREVLRRMACGTASGSTRWNIARPALFLVDRPVSIRYSFSGDKQHEFPSHDEIVAALRAGS